MHCRVFDSRCITMHQQFVGVAASDADDRDMLPSSGRGLALVGVTAIDTALEDICEVDIDYHGMGPRHSATLGFVVGIQPS